MSANLAKISILIAGSLRRLDGTSFQVTLSSGEQIAEVSSCSVNKLSTPAQMLGKLADVCGKHTLLVKYMYMCTWCPELSLLLLSCVKFPSVFTSTYIDDIFLPGALDERFSRIFSRIMTFVLWWSTVRRGAASIRNSLYASRNKRSIATGIFFITTVRHVYCRRSDGRYFNLLAAIVYATSRLTSIKLPRSLSFRHFSSDRMKIEHYHFDWNAWFVRSAMYIGPNAPKYHMLIR